MTITVNQPEKVSAVEGQKVEFKTSAFHAWRLKSDGGHKAYMAFAWPKKCEKHLLDTMRMRIVSLDASPLEKFQVVLFESLCASEECDFRFGKAFFGEKLGPGEFKRAGNVRCLKQPIVGRFDVGDEFGTGCKYGECLPEEESQIGLSVVVVHLELVEGGQFIRLRQQESDDLLEKRIMDVLRGADEVLVNDEAFVRYVDIVKEEEHATENTSSLFTVHSCLFRKRCII